MTPTEGNDYQGRWPVTGHEWAVRFLRLSIAHDRVSHAYVFSGPSSVGKTTLALTFAKTLNCQSRTSPGGDHLSPCGECPSCQQIGRGCHPDVRVISLKDQALLQRRDSGTQKEIGIDTIREQVVASAANRPLQGAWKVYILDNADKLSSEAANALLKTLEEGYSFNIIILVTENEGAMFPTVLSRCQRIGLRAVPYRTVREALLGRGVVEDRASLLSSLSQGRVGWAFSAAAGGVACDRREEEIACAGAVLGLGRLDRISLAGKLSGLFSGGKRDQTFAYLDAFTNWWRDLLLAKTGCEDLIVNVDRRSLITEHSKALVLDDIHRSLIAVSEAIRELELNVNPRLALDNLLLSLPFAPVRSRT